MHIPEPISNIVRVLILVVAASACDQETDLVVPTPSGTIMGQVTIDGSGASGVTVALSNGRTATTGATGGYTFTNVFEGAYTVSISGFPRDVSFLTTTQAVVLATPGQAVPVNFAGTRVGAPVETQATVAGTLTCIGGDTSHDQFVFNARTGTAATVRVTVVNNSTVTIAGISGFAPSSLPTLTGTVNAATGAGTASGSGTIAGRGNVSVTASGTLTGGRLEVEIVVGGQSELPGGQPVRYRFVATQ